MTLLEELSAITNELKYLNRDGSKEGSSGKIIRFHSENGIRDAIKQKLSEHNICMTTRSIDCSIVRSTITEGGNRIYSTMQVEAKMNIELSKGDDIETFRASACAIGDDHANASSVATTLAERNWMKAQFQITYDPEEEVEEIEEAPPSLEMSPAMTNNSKLIITRAGIAKLKIAAKKAGYRPSSWNLNKMTAEDLLHCSGIAIDLVVKSSQADTLDKVSGGIEGE